MYDVLICGGGPAGITAGIYAARGGAKVALIEKTMLGGQAALVESIENYPGFSKIGGVELMRNMEAQLMRFDAEIIYGEITGLKFAKAEGDPSLALRMTKPHTVLLADGGRVKAKTVVLAMGAGFKKLGVPGEERLTGFGVSYCATCDGAFYKDKIAAVAGGGNAAAKDALYLADIAKKVYWIRREFKGAKILADKLGERKNISIIESCAVTEITGGQTVTGCTVKNLKTGKTEKLAADGVFIAVGHAPATHMLPAVSGLLNPEGYIITDEHMNTCIPGVYAAGDIRENSIRQIVTACADGAVAAESAVLGIKAQGTGKN